MLLELQNSNEHRLDMHHLVLGDCVSSPYRLTAMASQIFQSHSVYAPKSLSDAEHQIKILDLHLSRLAL